MIAHWQEWTVGFIVLLCLARVAWGIWLFFRRVEKNENACDSCVSGCDLRDMLEKKRSECVNERTAAAPTAPARRHTPASRTKKCCG